MATIINRNGICYAQFFNSKRIPTTKRFSLKTSDKRIARHRLAKWEEDAAFGRFDPWVDDPWMYEQKKEITTGAAFIAFLNAKRNANLAPSTIDLYRLDLLPLVRIVGESAPLRSLTAPHINLYVGKGIVAVSTKAKRYRLARVFLKWAVEQDYLDANPISKVYKPQEKDTLPRLVRPDDLEKICAALICDYERKVKRLNGVHEGDLIWAVPLFWFALYTGMRIGELALLRWKHVDFERRLIYILRQKNGKQQTIPLNKKAAEILGCVKYGEPDEYVFRSPQTPSNDRKVKSFKCIVGKIFQRYRKAAGLPDGLCFHGLRHGFCTMLAEASKSAVVIKEAARHTNIATSMRYVHISNEHLKAELDEVFR